MHIIREVYFGWSLRYIHSSGASFVFAFVFCHVARALHYGSYYYIPNTWSSGILLFFFLMMIAFMGYVLPWGSMSFWGATVITNLLSPVPCLVEWVCGGFFVENPTLSRFFVFHFILPGITIALIFVHLFYLHHLSSNNPLGNNTNNKIPFFPFIFSKDIFGFCIFIFNVGAAQTFFGFLSLSHPDNAFEVSGLVTPLHIVPEWYFLSFYAILKAIPSKNAGFMILFSSIFMLFLFAESLLAKPQVRGAENISFLSFIPPPLPHLSRLSLYNGNFSISCFMLSFLSFLWIGAQLPQEVFIFYGRLLTLLWALLATRAVGGDRPSLAMELHLWYEARP